MQVDWYMTCCMIGWHCACIRSAHQLLTKDSFWSDTGGPCHDASWTTSISQLRSVYPRARRGQHKRFGIAEKAMLKSATPTLALSC